MKITTAFIFLGILFGADSWAKDKVLWDAWYTMTASSGVHYAIYHDLVEVSPKKFENEKFPRIHFTNKTWKLDGDLKSKEQNSIRSEQVGDFALDNDELTPLFYNYHMTFHEAAPDLREEVVIDGTMTDGTKFTAKGTKNGEAIAPKSRTFPTGTIFSEFFPVWLWKKLRNMKKGTNYSFVTLVEDDYDEDKEHNNPGFKPAPGTARLEEPDEYAKKHSLLKLAISFDDKKFDWYVDSKGIAAKIFIPLSGITIEKVTSEKVARDFLGIKH